MIYTRIILKDHLTIDKALETLNAKKKSEFTFYDLIYQNKNGASVTEDTLKIRVYQKNEWNNKNVFVIQKTAPFENGAKKDAVSLREEFDTVEEAKEFVHTHFEKEYEYQLTLEKTGTEYENIHLRIWVENIKEIGWSVEFGSESSDAIEKAISLFDVKERLRVSVPEYLLQKKMLSYDTLAYYNQNAGEYFEQTVEADLQQSYDKFLTLLPKDAYILDFGCGSGRDSKYFIEKGCRVKAIDGSIEMCKLATKYIGQEVFCMKFEDLNETEVYDGIWACSSILHVEKEQLPNILLKMLAALKKNGVIYTCFKKGTGIEIKEGKYYHYLTKEELDDILSKLAIKATIIDYYETNSSVKRPDKPIWNNFLIRKV